MIIKSFLFQVYSILVHGPDVMMPDADPFCTMYKYGKFHPIDTWSEDEQKIAAWALTQALANPRKITESIESVVLENLP
jgi:hypothetical protein